MKINVERVTKSILLEATPFVDIKKFFKTKAIGGIFRIVDFNMEEFDDHIQNSTEIELAGYTFTEDGKGWTDEGWIIEYAKNNDIYKEVDFAHIMQVCRRHIVDGEKILNEEITNLFWIRNKRNELCKVSVDKAWDGWIMRIMEFKPKTSYTYAPISFFVSKKRKLGNKKLIEAGHYYTIKGITSYSEISEKICKKIKNLEDKTMLFIDDVHGLYDMFPEERNNIFKASKKSNRVEFDFIVKESEFMSEASEVLSMIENFGKVKNSKHGKHFSGVKLFDENNFPTCVMLDICLTLKKKEMGFNHLINILPEFYLPQQEKLKKIISKILPEIKLEIILFNSEEDYRYL